MLRFSSFSISCTPAAPLRAILSMLAVAVVASSPNDAWAKSAVRTTTVSVPTTHRAGVVMVPVRRVFQKLGATVTYSAPPAATDITRAGASILALTVGKRQVRVHGKAHNTTVAPYISRGRVMSSTQLV